QSLSCSHRSIFPGGCSSRNGSGTSSSAGAASPKELSAGCASTTAAKAALPRSISRLVIPCLRLIPSFPNHNLGFDRVGDKALLVGEVMKALYLRRRGCFLAAIDNL